MIFGGKSGCSGVYHSVNIQIFAEITMFWTDFLSLGSIFLEEGPKMGLKREVYRKM